MAPEVKRVTARDSPVDEGQDVRLDVVHWNPGASVVWQAELVIEDRTGGGRRELGRLADIFVAPFAETTSVVLALDTAGTRKLCARLANAQPTNFPVSP